MKTELTDVVLARGYGLCLGFAALAYKTDSAAYDCNHSFICNETNDSWFRRDSYSGFSSGYGLNIIQMNVSKTAKFKPLGNSYQVISVKLVLLDNNESDITEEEFWLYIHKDFTLAEVQNYIWMNSHNWRP